MGLAFLLRHGRSTANVEGVLAGRMPGIALHATGVTQAQRVARSLAGTQWMSIHVSPLQRTQETAHIVVQGATWHTAPEIIECEYGDWTGAALRDLEPEPLWKELHEDPSHVRFPAGESIREVAQRCTTYVQARASESGKHLFITHADPILMIANAAAGAPLASYQRLHVDTCSLTIVHVIEHSMRLLALNIPAEGIAAFLHDEAR